MGKTKNHFLTLLKDAGVHKNIMEAFAKVDRKKFFDPIFHDSLFDGVPLPIGQGQKSDDAVILARMIGLLAPKKKWRLLEVGTGSGYSTAVLASLAEEVVTIEYHEELAMHARDRLTGEGYKNIRYFIGDAADMVETLGDFDGAIVFAACRNTPFSVVTLLKNNGVMVFPMGPAHQQQIIRYVNNLKADNAMANYSFHDLCVFDSLRGKYGWADAVDPNIEIGDGSGSEESEVRDNGKVGENSITEK